MDLKRFTSITSDSRQVKPGSLFVAIRGESRDGHDFIDEAIAEGASAIIGEKPIARALSVPYTQVPDSRLALAEAAAEFFGHPSRSLKLIGITGTSGKTTCTYLVESILHACGYCVGVIGTVNFRYGFSGGSTVLDSSHTTPDPVQIQELLARMKSAGVTHVVMEVSSHALKQKRVAGLEFDAAAFTNLSPEHLDYHKDMEDYFASKKVLFSEVFETSRRASKHPVAVINADDTYGYRLLEELEESDTSILSFGTADPEVLISGKDLRSGVDGISGSVEIRGERIRVESALLGGFNIANILTAIGITEALGVSAENIRSGIEQLKGVPGRLERVPNGRGIHVFVDYAHKPDALEKVLKNLQMFRKAHRLITVFGCGGDRDRTKRPVMGKIAETLSDQVFVTSDNPRTENPDSIIAEIVHGMAGTSYKVEPDRKMAIESALAQARPGDLVLIAGKGHEDYQIIGTRKHPFDDRQVASNFLTLPFENQ